jgi:outer membrane protein assembly factor BamB
VALSPVDGSIMWRQPAPGGIASSSPYVWNDGTIFVNAVLASDYTGAEPVDPWIAPNEAVISTMVLSADGTVLDGTSDKMVYALNAF